MFTIIVRENAGEFPPLEGALIQVTDASNGYLWSAVTDADGVAVVDAPSEEYYTFTISASGFLPITDGLRLSEGGEYTYTLTPAPYVPPVTNASPLLILGGALLLLIVLRKL